MYITTSRRMRCCHRVCEQLTCFDEATEGTHLPWAKNGGVPRNTHSLNPNQSS